MSLLLSLRHASAAFQMSEEHLFVDGLMEAIEIDDNNNSTLQLRIRLQDILRTVGHEKGTSPSNESVASGCFRWLEMRERLFDILELGNCCNTLLEDFLRVIVVVVTDIVVVVVVTYI